VKIGKGIRQGCWFSLVLFNLYSQNLTKEALEGCGGFRIGRQVIYTVKYAVDFVLRSVVDRLIETGRCYSMLR
jgi:hypothetical protein